VAVALAQADRHQIVDYARFEKGGTMRFCILVGLALMVAACELTPTETALPTTAPIPVPSATFEAPTAIGLDTTMPQTVEKTLQTSLNAGEMRWETSGGGQITFVVTRNGPSFDVAVSSYQFEDRQQRFMITPESGEVYRAISAVMQGQGKIRVHTSNEPRGSWTTLEFSDGEHADTFEDVITDGDLRFIYDYVTAQLEP
jgi:hypothetical protein